MTDPVRGTTAGVPFIALPPASGAGDSPVVLLWHLLAPPASPQALAAALPLQHLEAWRVYLEVPMTGSRLPEGGLEELNRRGTEDAVLELHNPITEQGGAEFPAVLADLRGQLGVQHPTYALVGGSQGSAVAARVALETASTVPGTLAGLVLISPVIRLRAVVEAVAAMLDFTYQWSPESVAVADRMDLVNRSAELTMPVQIVVGSQDDGDGFVAPARELHAALPDSELLVVEGMGHALAEAPGTEAAPQTTYAVQVDRAVTHWLSQVLADG